MLRHGETLRLTSTERNLLSTAAGYAVNPKTVVEHNAIVDRAVRDLNAEAAMLEVDLDEEGVDHSGVAELNLLAAFAAHMHVAH